MQPIAYQGAPQTGCDSSPQTVASGSFPLSEHLPLPLDILEYKLRHEPFTILAAKSTSGGSTSAMRLTLQFQDCSVVHVKWRAATASGQAYNNNPRKELVAYAIQKLFLDPKDYVVPVTIAACISKDVLNQIGAPFQVQREGINCVFGTLAVWLKQVTVLEQHPDETRFEQSLAQGETSGYAWHYANMNIFTYLISHRDGRKGNFVMSDHPQSARVFSIDNGLAFSGLGNPRPFIPRLSRLKVDRLPRATIERLRQLTPEQLSRHLETVWEFHIAADGRVRSVTDFSANIAPNKGVRGTPTIAQIGLTRKEITSIANRLRKLLERVDRQEIELF